MEQAGKLMRNIMIACIRCYQVLISPCMKPCCRFYPSCSQYTLAALKQWGIIPGLWMGLKRILRCHPWSAGGYDPILPNDETH